MSLLHLAERFGEVACNEPSGYQKVGDDDNVGATRLQMIFHRFRNGGAVIVQKPDFNMAKKLFNADAIGVQVKRGIRSAKKGAVRKEY